MASFREILKPPTFADEDITRKAKQLNFFLLAATLLLLIFLIIRFTTFADLFRGPNLILGSLMLILIGLVFTLRRGYVQEASYALVTLSWIALTYLAWVADGIRDVTFVAQFIVLLMAGLFLGWRTAVFFGFLTIVAGWGLAYPEIQSGREIHYDSAQNLARDFTVVFAFVILLLYLIINNLQQALNRMRQSNSDLQQLSATLENRVSERTRDLALAAEVGRSVSRIRDLSELLRESADLVRARFQLYYAQIYLVDEETNHLTLRAGTGDAGRMLLAQGHHLPINTRSINGKAAATKETVIVTDTHREPLFRPNAFLPRTRSEIAIPLQVGMRVAGILNMQSDKPDTFSDENLPALTALAGQLAVAIDNAQLFAERQRVEDDMARFKLGIERAASAVFLTAVDGTILYVNPEFEKMYGWSAEEVVGQTPRILKSGMIPQEQYSHFWQTLLDGGIVAGEIINKAKDGHLVEVAGSNNPIINEQGALIGFLSVHTDITERKNSEARLARSIAELNCMNDIGHHAEEQMPLPEFLQWVTERIPAAMPHPEHCTTAITVDEVIYGDRNAMSYRRHIVEGLRVAGQMVGRLYIAYADEQIHFVDEDSAFIGGIGQRISSYIESQRLLEQVEKRAAELQTVAQVGTTVAGTLDTTRLLQDVVNLTKDRFNLYHAHIYLMNESNDALILTTGAGEIGTQMVKEGRRILLSQQQSLVARAARTHQGVIVNDVRIEPGFLPHPLLPDTRSELAVPLLVGDHVLGVMDVQSDKVHYFTTEDINIQTTLATQVAVALQNAQQFEHTQLALEELSVLQQTLTREGWQAFLTADERPIQGYVASGKKLRPIWRKARSAEQETGNLLETLTTSETAVVNPVQIGGTIVGGLGIHLPANNNVTPQQQYLLQSLADQVSQALERARLSEQTHQALNETEKRTQELAILNEMGRAFTAHFEVDAIIGNIYRYTKQLINLEDMYVALYDASLDEVDIRIFGKGEELIESALKRRGGNGITEYVIRNREPLLIKENITDQAEKLGFDLVGRNAESWLGVPMAVGDEIIGVIAIQDFEKPFLFGTRETDLLTTVANQAAIAIQNTRLFAQTQSRARQEQILREVTTRVNAAVDAEAILRTAAQEVGRALGLETFVYLTDVAEKESEAISTTNGSATKVANQSG
ncbi:MAG: GAF domain-containing protein [Ardenticatenaceae bacterium]|nr:GAF domain-containing protein [Anaerolineales bacterium]MCB8923092.1 GAF domain-containing protein [Ardenticatenaceae bacterium]